MPRLKPNPKCTYCGAPATCRDHVVPRSYKRNTGKANWATDWTVPACHPCNGMLGALMILNVPDRAAYLVDRYIAKRRKFYPIELEHRLHHLRRVSAMPRRYMQDGRQALIQAAMEPEPTPEPTPEPMPDLPWWFTNGFGWYQAEKPISILD